MNARSRNSSLIAVAGAGIAAVAVVGAGLQLTSGSGAAPTDVQLAAANTGAVSISCPDVAGKIGAVPAQAQSQVAAELVNLQKQIDNVNARLAREPGAAQQQLGDIAGKRSAVIERIILDFTRLKATPPAGLRDLINCKVVNGAAGANNNTGNANNTAGNNNAGNNNNAGGATGGSAGGGAAAGVQTMNCPTVRDKLPAVPASAAAEVERNLTLLNTQIDEANARLAKLAVKPEGGPNFVKNAISGPLEDKRFAVLNRIATAIGRTAARPDNLQDLAPCTVNAAGKAAAAPAAGNANNNAGNTNNAGGATGGSTGGGAAAGVQTMSCPSVRDKLPTVPLSAQAEVERNLTLLNTQIAEANARLAKLAVKPEGGPNFVKNAISGPLEDKRFAVLNRIATAIGRTAARPNNLQDLAPCTVVG